MSAILIAGFVAGYVQRRAIQHWSELCWLRRAVLAYGQSPYIALFRQPPDSTEKTLPASVFNNTNMRYRTTLKDRMEGRLYPTQRIGIGYPWTVFLHERWTPGGKHRVVLVECNVIWFPSGSIITGAVELFDAGTLLHPAFTILPVQPARGLALAGSIPGSHELLFKIAKVSWGRDFELFPARPDPSDAAALLFDVRFDGATRTLKGRIDDDGTFDLTASDGSVLPLGG